MAWGKKDPSARQDGESRKAHRERTGLMTHREAVRHARSESAGRLHEDDRKIRNTKGEVIGSVDPKTGKVKRH
jgi:hypothetical protein